MQRDALTAVGCARIFEDLGVSGAKSARPGLDQALAYVRERDTLVVWKLDRLGLSVCHLIDTVQDFEARGVGLRSLTEQIDTMTRNGRLIFHIFGALGQFERDLSRERALAGLSAAAARGRNGGRKSVVTPEVLRKAHVLIGQGLQAREAAARLKVGKAALYEALAESDVEPAARFGSSSRENQA